MKQGEPADRPCQMHKNRIAPSLAELPDCQFIIHDAISDGARWHWQWHRGVLAGRLWDSGPDNRDQKHMLSIVIDERDISRYPCWILRTLGGSCACPSRQAGWPSSHPEAVSRQGRVAGCWRQGSKLEDARRSLRCLRLELKLRPERKVPLLRRC